jgi:membrane protein required for colicin V production
MGIAFALLFVLVLIAGGILGVLANRAVRGTGLTGTDRSLGVIFGLLRGALLVALLVFLASLTPLPEEPWWEQSRLVPEFQRLVAWLLEQVPQSLQKRLRGLPTEA